MPVSQQPRNLLLGSLSPAPLEMLLKHADFVHLELKENLIEANKSIQFVDFPEFGVMSVLRRMDDGTQVEIATIGNEGMIGFPLLMGVDTIQELVLCQVEAAVWRLPAAKFLELSAKEQELRTVCLRYLIAYADQISHNLACLQKHSLEERCARWLVTTHDRCGKDEFPLTQEFLAAMLGVSRTSVNLAAGMLAKANLISYTRGKIRIIDRKGLEEVTCQCYFSSKKYSEKIRNLHSRL